MRSKFFGALSIVVFVFIAAYYLAPHVLIGPLVQLSQTAAGLTAKKIQVGDHTIHYLEGGSGETILLLHGIFAEKNHWLDFARHFGKGYHLIIPDIAAFGESTRLPDGSYDYQTQVARLSNFLSKLEIKSLHIAGNSMGGTIAALYSIQFPEQIQSLAFIGAPHGIRTPFPSEMDQQLDAQQAPLVVRSPDEFETMMDLLFVKRPFLPRPIYLDARDKAIREADGNSKIFARQLQDRYLLQSKLEKIQHRTLVLWGGAEKVFHPSGAEVLRETLKNSDVKVLQDIGHLPQMEAPQLTAELYRGFVEKK